MKQAKFAGLMLLGLSAVVASAAQEQQGQSQRPQQQSVAEAAKKAKEQQKNAPKAQTVWTNDSIGSVQGTVNVMGQSSAAQSASQTAAGAAAGTTASKVTAAQTASAGDLAKLQSQLADAKNTLASAKTDLDIAQRKYDLDAAQYYSTPNYSADKQGQTTLDGEKSAIATKKQAADAAQKAVDNLTKQIKALGGKVETAPAKSATPQS